MLSRRSQLPRNLATRRAARARSLPPRLRCQRLAAIVAARQVQKEEAWLSSVSLNSRDDPAVPVGVLWGIAEVVLLELHNDERDLGLQHFPRLGVLVDPPSWLRNPVSGRDRLN